MLKKDQIFRKIRQEIISGVLKVGEDELSRLRKNIAAEKSEFDAATEKRTAELDAREADISSKEEAFARLEMQVADFPAAIDAAVIKARSELSDKLIIYP